MATETTEPTKPARPPLPQHPPEVLEPLKDKQGVRKTANLEHLLGAGQQLWADDAELDAFLKAIDAAGPEGD